TDRGDGGVAGTAGAGDAGPGGGGGGGPRPDGGRSVVAAVGERLAHHRRGTRPAHRRHHRRAPGPRHADGGDLPRRRADRRFLNGLSRRRSRSGQRSEPHRPARYISWLTAPSTLPPDITITSGSCANRRRRSVTATLPSTLTTSSHEVRCSR